MDDQQMVAAYFKANPGRPFSVQEVARTLDIDVQAASNTVAALAVGALPGLVTAGDGLWQYDAPVECPAWCETDHGAGPWPHEIGDITVRRRRGGYTLAEFTVAAMDLGGTLEMHAHGHILRTDRARADGHLWFPPAMAEGLAGLVEVLGDATPAQHRQFADAIRAARAKLPGDA